MFEKLKLIFELSAYARWWFCNSRIITFILRYRWSSSHWWCISWCYWCTAYSYSNKRVWFSLDLFKFVANSKGQAWNYFKVNKMNFSSLDSFINLNQLFSLKLPGPLAKAFLVASLTSWNFSMNFPNSASDAKPKNK